MKSEINKRSFDQYGWYHILLCRKVGNRKKNISTLFLRKREIELLFSAWAEKGFAAVGGNLVHFNSEDQILVTVGVIQKNEKDLYCEKKQLRSDEAFIRKFKDVTSVFYNNEWINKIKHTPQPQVAPQPAVDTIVNNKHSDKMKEIKIIKDKIGEGELRSAIELLMPLVDGTTLEDDVILLNSRNNNNERNKGIGTLSTEAYNLEYSKISSALLETCRTLIRNTPVSPPVTKVHRAEAKPSGYCIRTGKKIAFDPEKPMSVEAYREWARYGNIDYPEKFCHFSGEPSNDNTSFAHPILKKNWQKAKEVHGF